MRKKLLSIQNMRSMIMQQTLRKQNSEKNVEIISINQFRQKLEKLLEKVTIQTKYTNRVSQCHLKNVEELQHVKQELNHLIQLRKMEETNEIMLKNLSNQLAQTLNGTQQRLLIVTNQLFGLKKQLKQTKIQLFQLKKTNQKLQAEVRRAQREKYHSLIELHDKEDHKFLSNQIEDYVKEVRLPQCQLLYQHCLQTLRTKNYDNFIKGLEQKINCDTKMKSIEIESRDTLKLKEKEKLRNLIIKRKISNVELRTSGYTSHHKTKSKFIEDPFRFPSFRTKTQGSASMPKYSLS